MKLKKILSSVIAAAMVLSSMSASVFAIGDSDETNAVAMFNGEYYSTVEKALIDATASSDAEVTITVLKDVASLPAPTRAGLTFEAADGIKVTYRVNPPRFTKVDGLVKYVGFDFSTYDAGNGLFACFDGGHELEGLEVVFEDCLFGGEKSIGIWGWATASAAESITVDNCSIIDGSKAYFTFGKVNNIVFSDCDFSNYTAGQSIIQLPEYAGNVTVTGCNFGNGFINYAPNQGDFKRSLNIADSTFNGAKAVNIHSNFTNSTITWDEVSVTNNTLGGITPVFAFPANVDAEEYIVNNATTFNFADNLTVDGDEVTDLTVPVDGVATVNGVYYETLDEAISAAAKGDTIDLLGNVIDINISKDNYDANKNLTFKNGTLDFTNAGASTALFWLSNNETITFEKVKFVKEHLDNAKFMCYLMTLESVNNVATFNECEFDLDTAIYSSYFANNGGGKFIFNNCKIYECNGSNFVYGGGALFDTCEYNTENGDIIAHNNYPSEIRNSQVVTKRIRIRNVSLTPGVIPTVTITGNSNVVAAVGISYTSTPADGEENALIVVEKGSTLIAENADKGILPAESEGTIISKADTIYVQFRNISTGDDYADKKNSVWEIVLVGANSETINELASVDLTFENKSKLAADLTKENPYTIAAKAGMTLSKKGDNRYMFSFDANTVEETDTEILLGTVTFGGYGALDFKVNASAVDEAGNASNVVNATEIRDSIVETFVVGGATDSDNKTGDLKINEDAPDALDKEGNLVGVIVGTSVEVPSRNLKINVTFPNAVEDNVIAYQDMVVTVKGTNVATSKVDTFTYNLGEEDGNAMDENGNYVIDNIKLSQNGTYTVTVTGAGYRTVSYDVHMTDDKELTFWNNVMDAPKVVEKDNADSAKTVTFLAGDIVKDDNINIYDLSAVVSYFATPTDTTTADDNRQYDLNRDGMIDSKDVAYVLVSWGK